MTLHNWPMSGSPLQARAVNGAVTPWRVRHNHAQNFFIVYGWYSDFVWHTFPNQSYCVPPDSGSVCKMDIDHNGPGTGRFYGHD